MKKILMILAAIIMAFPSCKPPAQKPQAKTVVQFFTFFQTQPLFLNGQVKSVNYRTYWAVKNGNTFEKGDLITNEERDSLGFAYDFNAYFTEEGIIEKSEILNGNEVLMYWDVENDGQVFILAKRIVNDTANLVIKYKYDENFHMIAANVYRAGVDTLISKYKITTNESGFITKNNSFSKDDQPRNTYTFNLDENNRYLEQKNFNNNDSLVFHIKRMYNDKGLISDSEVIVSSKYSGNKIKYDYKAYDEKGNWTIMNFIINGEVISVEEIQIEYYD